MQSRMDKYYNKAENAENIDFEENIESTSRIHKNQTLYKEVSNRELEEFDLNSNVSVIGEGNNVDIDKIREMLDRKYRELPKNKSIGKAELELGKINLDETREYDLKSILEKAHDKKEINYEEDRLKKLRNTQYDILKSLDITLDEDEEIEEKEEESVKVKAVAHENEEKKLQELIHTITAKELLTKEDLTSDLDPLDILSDLRGDDENTKVLGALSEEPLLDDEFLKKRDTLGIEIEDVEEEKKTMEIKPIEVNVNLIEKEKKDSKKEEVNFTSNDFDDFNDLKEDMKFTKVLVKILIFVIIVILLIGCVFLANELLNLGLF